MSASDEKLMETYHPATFKYSIVFHGSAIDTVVTNEASVAEEWVQIISSKYAGNPTVVGLDTEWMLDSNQNGITKGNRQSMKTAVLQLCVDNTCLIFQLYHMDALPQPLRTFMTDSNFTFVGVGVLNDMKMLKNDYGLECQNGIDVADLAKKRYPRQLSGTGLKYLTKELVGLDMKKPKDITTSEWQARELSEAQIEYACIDAYVSYRIGHKLLTEEGIVHPCN